MNKPLPTCHMMGVSITTFRSVEETVFLASDWIKTADTPRTVFFLNPHSYVLSRFDKEFSKALKRADLLLPDGIGIMLAAKLLRKHIPTRITGSSFFRSLCKAQSQNLTGTCFLLGSTESNLCILKSKIEADFPGLKVTGTYSPPFAEEFDTATQESILNAINDAKPDVLWVGMTAPKQEKWIYQNQDRLNVPVIAAIGAVFDYYSGKVKRPSKLTRRLGLEWLVRLVNVRGRTWKRIFISGPIFLGIVLIDEATNFINDLK